MKELCICFAVACVRVVALSSDSALIRRALQVEEDTRSSSLPSGRPLPLREALLIDRHGQPIETDNSNDDRKTKSVKVTTNVTKTVIVKVTEELRNATGTDQKYQGPHPLDWYLRSNATSGSNSSSAANMTSNTTSNGTATAEQSKSGTWVPMPSGGKEWVPMPSGSRPASQSSSQPSASSQTNATTNASTNSSGATNATSTNSSKDTGDWFKAKNSSSDNSNNNRSKDHDDWFKDKNSGDNSDSKHHGDWFKTKNYSGGDTGASNPKASNDNSSSPPGQQQPQDNSATSGWSYPWESGGNSSTPEKKSGGHWSMFPKSNWSTGWNWSLPHFNIGTGWHRRRHSSNSSSFGWPSFNFSHEWGDWQSSSKNSADSTDDRYSEPGSTVYPTPSPSPSPSPTPTLPLDRPFAVADQ